MVPGQQYWLSGGWQLVFATHGLPTGTSRPLPPPVPASGTGEQTPPWQLLPEGHAVHTCPPPPHAALELPRMHAQPKQHPLHVCGPQRVQLPLMQSKNNGHGAHCCPAVPHACDDGVWQPIGEQQPSGQVRMLQEVHLPS